MWRPEAQEVPEVPLRLTPISSYHFEESYEESEHCLDFENKSGMCQQQCRECVMNVS